MGSITRDASPEEKAAYRHGWYEANRPAIISQAKQWYYDNRECILAKHKERYAETRVLVIEAYGERCACCGEDTPEFLTLDHINGGGNAHRRKVGADVWSWARRNNFPDILQLMCYNCNGAKDRSLSKTCPHQTKRNNGTDSS